MSDLFLNNARKIDAEYGQHEPPEGVETNASSTDMGNVSHVLPTIHPCFYIGTDACCHTRAFTGEAGWYYYSRFYILCLCLLVT